MTDRERLKALLVERSVRLGDFTLASGARSSYYVDARVTTMSAEGQARLGKVALEALDASGISPSHVGGLTMGADPVAYAIAGESFRRDRPIDGFSVRKKAKEHGTGQRVEGGLPQGAKCLVVEDSMTTGGSTLKAIEAIREYGAEPIAVLTVVDREEGGAEAIATTGLPLIALYTGTELLEAARSSER
jgi:orotate phosphoribosyltransferase